VIPLKDEKIIINDGYSLIVYDLKEKKEVSKLKLDQQSKLQLSELDPHHQTMVKREKTNVVCNNLLFPKIRSQQCRIRTF
jgi:phosphoenolpyruvate synthase/pyruvate phosphate dikinase